MPFNERNKIFKMGVLRIIKLFVVFTLVLHQCNCLAQYRSDHSEYQGLVLQNPFDNYVDNRKPAFLNCKDYAPVVKEEQPLDTYVIRVEATDPDKNDTIEYSFVRAASERPRFKINSRTGEIFTSHVFDRDEPIHEKKAYITVRATDNGRPPLDDVCTFKVTIADINDNPPVFDKVKYDESMSEDMPINVKPVMRITASDLDDGNNSIIEYSILDKKDSKYFRIDKDSGFIYLVKPIDRKPGQRYTLDIRAANTNQDMPQDAQTEVQIRIIESNKKAPMFISPPVDPIYLQENFSDYSANIVTLHAFSNIPDSPELVFELITGRTEQTNSKQTFVFNQTGSETASIKLGKALDYEAITEYSLTMSVKNTYQLVAEHVIKIKVEDVNDNIPYFTEVTTGQISENEPPGTPVMQIRAFDMDGTSANNIVTFELVDNKEYFFIDSNTGNITALTTFDREERDFYNVKVVATDNSPSSLYKDGQHNKGVQVFRIEIADKNDHPPKFQQPEYIAEKLAEDANINYIVIEVTAMDNDTASQISYSIVNGNIGDAFKIEPSTGKITVNSPLDYENITEYKLRIRAFDGHYEDFATVLIRIEDVNDNPPVFVAKYSTTIEEEKLIDGCILEIEAYDPDIKDRSLDQNIKYSVVNEAQKHLFEIDSKGCMKLLQPLDRDLPNGRKHWQVLVDAIDMNGNGLRIGTDVEITLTDINDNAPFITNKQPVVWYENQQSGPITELIASDYDEPENGAPFKYELDTNANEDIRSKFLIENDELHAIREFDREQQKEYFIPILVTDSGRDNQMSNVSILHLVIGDVNDNAMKEGSSKIFVYNYKGEAPDTTIGRVYVDDPDDWDLPDKSFIWKDTIQDRRFHLNSDTGMITMLSGTEEGVYTLFFTVFEQSRDIKHHDVTATVEVTVKQIPEEAVDKSGSIRFYGITAEEFIEVPGAGSLSKKDQFRNSLSQLLNTSVENVDVFTVLQGDNSSILDVRFSAHGSPYYEPERLNGIVAQRQNDLEQQLDIKMLMINIDECLIERNKCESSCTNVLHKSPAALLVYTNTTSFVGVNAFVQPECICSVPTQVTCLNGGTQFDNFCECPDGFEGPQCELLSIGFTGDGYALYPPFNPCDSTNISLELTPATNDGLVMYIGPMNYNPLLPISDFLSLELIKGYPVLTVDYGSGAIRIEHRHIALTPSKTYTIDIILQRRSIEMRVDNCRLSTCMSLGAPQGPNEFLNVNSPLHLGGVGIDLEYLAGQYKWAYIPQNTGYYGCIRNLTIDDRTYNVGAPSISKNIDVGCGHSVAVAISFGIDKSFLFALIACIAVLLILVLALVVCRRRNDGWPEKDTDDIRENIIDYEEEGGGERDTEYDLSVLRKHPIYDERPFHDDLMQRQEPNEVPDIGGFLTDKKDTCDKDNDAHPVDDVRHYAYEGDGNSVGSLSSLASCTDDGDLNFDCLSNFGPRFRKLADMYGEEPSDTESNGDTDGAWDI